MKSVLSFLGIVGSISLYLCAGAGGAHAQLFEDPSVTFQNITFDQVNRGSYNNSECLHDLLNCWEAVKPDLICFHFSYHSTVCNVVREFCAEGYGDQYNYSLKWNMVEGMCWNNDRQSYT